MTDDDNEIEIYGNKLQCFSSNLILLKGNKIFMYKNDQLNEIQLNK